MSIEFIQTNKKEAYKQLKQQRRNIIDTIKEWEEQMAEWREDVKRIDRILLIEHCNGKEMYNNNDI